MTTQSRRQILIALAGMAFTVSLTSTAWAINSIITLRERAASIDVQMSNNSSEHLRIQKYLERIEDKVDKILGGK